MTTEELTDEIIELVYHSACVSDDPYVQERSVRAGVWDLIEQYDNEKQDESDFAELSRLESEVKQLENEVTNLEDTISDLRLENSELRDTVRELEAA